MTDRRARTGRTTLFATMAAIALAVGLILAPQAFATTGSGAFPIKSKPYGQTYGEWSAAWWQWLTSVPAEVNPIFDASGDNCGEGQSGHVWYLAGTFGGDPVQRDCSVSTGTAILFPIVNAICFDTPGLFDEQEEIQANIDACAEFIDDATNLHVTVDGVTLDNLEAFRAQSPVFDLPLAEDSVFSPFGVPAGDYKAISDGYWIILHPLPPGEYTINFGGDVESAELSVDVTYNLTIE